MSEDRTRSGRPQVTIPESELEVTFSRSPGPGGQNVNKLNTKATLRWSLAESESISETTRERFAELFPTRITQSGEVVISSSRFREAPRNKQDCIARLHDMLRSAATRPKQRRKTRPTRGSVERRLDEKRQRSEKKRLRRPPGA